MNREKHIEKFLEMYPDANPEQHPRQFQYYLKMYKYLWSKGKITMEERKQFSSWKEGQTDNRG